MDNKDNSGLALVSVVVATYNGEKYIREQLDSILLQTYPNIELIVTDDASTDNTLNILQEYAAKHNRVKIISSPKNVGYVKNFERGLIASSGDFIAPGDQDDIWDPSKIEILVNSIGSYAIAYCDSAIIDKNGNKIGRNLSDVKNLISFDNCLMFTIGNTAAGHAMLLTKEVVKNSLPLPTVVPHDYWLGFVATFNSALKFINQPLVLYRQHEANVFGLKIKGNKRVKKKKDERAKTLAFKRERIRLLYEKCPESLSVEKRVFYVLNKSYQDFSLKNNFIRMMTFFKHRDAILAYKKRTALRRWLFCLKMFWKIE